MVNPFIPILQSYLPEPEASLLVGMLFGGKQGFTNDFYQALLTTGTIHVVALSGTNVSILVNMIGKATSFLGRKLSSIVSILAILGFIIFVGPSATIVRAGLMGAMTLLSVYFGRQRLVLLSLVLTGIIMVIVSPKIIGELSFQLSFLATLGIIVFSPQKAAQKGIKGLLWENLRTTLSAQAATLPIIVFAFGRISLVSPLTNVLIGWTIVPITILGILISLIGLVIYPMGQILAWFVYLPLHYFVKIVEITSQFTLASLTLK